MNDLQEWYKRVDELAAQGLLRKKLLGTQLLPNKTFHLWVQAEDFGSFPSFTLIKEGRSLYLQCMTFYSTASMNSSGPFHGD